MERDILIVDDSESIRELVGGALEKAGFKVHKGVNGKDGLDRLMETGHSVSLVITDLFMPVMDGIDLIKAIRKQPDHQYTPILMLTTESQLEKKMEGKRAGATGWMVKPFEEERLLKTVYKIIR